jgi:hypothetical protein
LFSRRFIGALCALTVIAGGCVQVAQHPSAPTANAGSSVGAPRSLGVPATGVATPGASVAASADKEAPTAPASAGDGSIVFVKAGDVWIAAPDGTQGRQLTHDGAQTGYHDPAQSPDGTIFALHGDSTVVRLDRASGNAMGAPLTLTTLENGAEGLTVSPDGTHFAYTTTGFGKIVDPRFGTPTGAFIYGGTDVADLTGTSVANAAMPEMIFPTWVDASTIAVSDGVKLYLDTLGSAPQTWLDASNGCLTDFDCPENGAPAANVTSPSFSRAGNLVAYVLEPYYGTSGGRVIAHVDAQHAQPPAAACTLTGQQNFSDPGSFSADGSSFAYDDTTFDPSTLESTVGQGIYVLDLDVSKADCGVSTAKLVLPGGAQPDWSPLAP